VTENANPLPVHLLEMREDGFGELAGDVAVHFIVLAPGLLCCVDVEAGAAAEVVGGVFAGDLEAAYGGIEVSSFPKLEVLATPGWGGSGSSRGTVTGVGGREGAVRGLVSGYNTAIPFWLAACWKNPFSAPLSPVHVKPAR